MPEVDSSLRRLSALNRIAESLNRAPDVNTALNSALSLLLELMGAETGWIFLADPEASERWAGRGFRLIAHHNLPPAMDSERAEAWDTACDCQGLFTAGKLDTAYNEVRCSRLGAVSGDRHQLKVHATSALRSGDRVLGILNIAAPSWDHFGPEELSLLTTVGSQMGIALERARLYDMMLERRIDEQRALLAFSNELLAQPEPSELMGHLVQSVRQLLRADACALFIPTADGHDLRFGAAAGWRGDPVGEGHLIPNNESSGPGSVMRNQQPLLIEDLEADHRAPWTASWVRAEDFQGHAVIPMIAEGRSVGTLVINDRHPRQFDADELRLLRLMANQGALALESARLHQEEIERNVLQEDLLMARRIQLSMLPRHPPELAGWEIAATYQPARLVGGDFFDFFELPQQSEAGTDTQGERHPRRLGVVIADVADKGMPAALYMALGRTLIRSTALSGRRPAEALVRANELIQKDSQADMFLSAFCGCLDGPTGEFAYANGGHNPPLWWHADGRYFAPLLGKGAVLGAMDEVHIDEMSIWLAPGDVLVLYTDGVTEGVAADGELFGLPRLQDALAPAIEKSAQQAIEAVMAALAEFSGSSDPADDVTLVVLRRLP
jgi:serine phosphatase RsbU (regulator of sigma subunit)